MDPLDCLTDCTDFSEKIRTFSIEERKKRKKEKKFCSPGVRGSCSAREGKAQPVTVAHTPRARTQ